MLSAATNNIWWNVVIIVELYLYDYGQQIICCWLFSSWKVVESISWEGMWMFWCHIWHCCEKINNYLTLGSHIYISTSNYQLSCQQYIHQNLTNKTQECTSICIFLLRKSFQTRFWWKWSVCPGISNIFNQIFIWSFPWYPQSSSILMPAEFDWGGRCLLWTLII